RENFRASDLLRQSVLARDGRDVGPMQRRDPGASSGARGHEAPQRHALDYGGHHPVSRYQYARFQRFMSQGPTSGPRKLWLTAETRFGQTTGITTTSSITRSFLRMKSTARVTESNSVTACL